MSALLLLRAVAAAGLLAAADALGVQGAADDLVAHSGEVTDAAAADQHDGMLLQVVADLRDVGGDLDVAGEPHSGDLAERGVRLLRCGGVDARADTAALRAALERRGVVLGYLVLAALPDQLLDRGHRVSVFVKSPGALRRMSSFTEPPRCHPGVRLAAVQRPPRLPQWAARAGGPYVPGLRVRSTPPTPEVGRVAFITVHRPARADTSEWGKPARVAAHCSLPADNEAAC